jgi:two-component system cell cycle sensor histidine kinase/response regulator CckA
MSEDIEELRLRRDELYRLLFEEASDGLFISSVEGVYLDVNRSGHRMLGYGEGELVGKHIRAIVLSHDAQRLDAALEAVSRGEEHTQVWTLVRKDGSLTQLEVLAQPLSNGTVLATVRDLTARAEFDGKIQASEAKLRSILHTAPDSIMSVERSGRLLFINRTQPPYTVEQVVGTSCFDYVPPDSRERVRQAIEHVFETRGLDEYEVEGPPDGQGVRSWVSVRVGPLIERDAVVAATLCATDVTYRKQAEKARARLEEQLAQSQKMESVGQLAGGVAHDFNNLLTVILSLVDLSHETQPNQEIREFLGGIRAAALRGAALTQELLAFARKKIVQPEDVDLGSTLTRLAPMMRRLVGEHITVDLTLAGDLGTVRVDAGSLERVIMNLVVNARDAMPSGGRLRLETSSFELKQSALDSHPELAQGRYALLSVIDTGTGITPDVRARLFEPFFTTKPPGSGSGLGLAMCHGIVTQAGGKIAVTTELDRGTSFHVYLPTSSNAEPAAAPPPSVRSSGRGNETILLVEDEPMILRIARRALEKLGYRVFSARDGVEGLEVAATISGGIDLLVTDVVMPRLGGRELALQLLELRPKTKVLYTSGYAENAIAFHGVLSDGVNFIQKPYSPSTLAERVRELLDRE